MSSFTPKFKRMRPALGTFVRVELELDSANFEIVSASLFATIDALENKLSFFKPESELSKLNETKPMDWISLSEETIHILKLSQALKNASETAFSAGNQLIFAYGLVQKTNEEKIDLGGIAKGYILDQAWAQAKKKTHDLGLPELYGSINAGGDLILNERETSVIAIQKSDDQFFQHPMKSGALATSSVKKRDTALANYASTQKVYRKTVTIEAKEAWLADALTKVALFHPNPKVCLEKWNARMVYED
jgi:thiamine biosynthesis lipoprotein ApbE